MKAVIYARFSSDRQREESIEGQIRECTEYAQRQGITIINTYVDRAKSASKDTEKRENFLRMVRDSNKHLFDIILVWKLDRFARSRYDSAHYKNLLKKNGVKVVSATENITDGPEGIILESMLEGMAEYYSAELSEKIHRGQKENALFKKEDKKRLSPREGTKAELFLLLQEKYPKEQAKGDPAHHAGSPLESLRENLSHQPRGRWQNVGKPSSNQ